MRIKCIMSIMTYFCYTFMGTFTIFLTCFAASSYKGSAMEISNNTELSRDVALLISSYCHRTCQNGTLVTRKDLCFAPSCFPCDCDKNCSMRGTCCPSMDSNRDEIVPYEIPKWAPGSYLNDLFYNVDCSRLRFSDDQGLYFVTVTKCPDTWNDENVKRKCEQPEGDSFESVTPFTDHTTGLIFANTFCLLCHGLDPNTTNSNYSDVEPPTNALNPTSTLEAWPIIIRCTFYQNLFHLDDRFQFYKRALQLHECDVRFGRIGLVTRCNQYFGKDKEIQVSSCSPNSNEILKEVCRTNPSVCSLTTNQTLVELCQTLPYIPALRVRHDKNIFCFLCNGYPYYSNRCAHDRWLDEEIPYYAYPPVMLLFVAAQRKGGDGKTSKCQTDQWENDEGECIPASCPPGKLVESGDSCKTALGDIQGLRYIADMTLVFPKTIPMDWLGKIIRSIHNKLDHLSDRVRLQYEFKWCVSGDGLSVYKQEIDVSGYIFAPPVSRDDFEEELVGVLTRSSWYLLHVDDKHRPHIVTLDTVCLGEDICNMYRNQSKTDNCFQSFHVDDVHDDDEETFRPVELIPSLTCPSVAFNLTAKPAIVDTNLVFTIGLRNQDVQVKWNSNISMVDGEFRLCLSYLQDLTQQLDKSSNQYVPFTFDSVRSIVLTISYFLDIVCISISCICLLASIATYLIFPSLLNIPGLNNLCLCLSLLTAQTFLLITSLLGARGLLHKIHCLIHAIILHYSWIASFVWMNTCCIHMFRIFTSPTVGSYKRQFLWYCIYSFGFPLFVVVILITVTHITTNGQSIGYETDICFLDTKTSSLIILLGFLAPLGLTVLINGVLFILTVKEIVWITKMQQQRRSTHGVITYLKMSTVTGAFCFFAATSVQFESPELLIISSPFAALQGLFIFVSFIANKRILNLYKDLICHRPKPDGSHNQSGDNVTSRNTGTKDLAWNSDMSEMRPKDQ